MKRSPKCLLLLSFMLLLFTCLPFKNYAQCPDQGFDPGCDPETCLRADGTYCPIDSYLYVLLGIGVLYGIKKVRKVEG